ncbi:sulfotransferase family protein [Halofilum ochraceum]|uniref:sulfotransferase family protein n=1 Tax=Halofilum ochraceum TaxID=1611323 RepID=UPI00083514B5|nr:sulfotransferase [Halofilum ochraceum]
MTTGRPPIIIIGMHRSGTSLLTRVLGQAGLFMGRGASRNEEAGFTNAVNAWLLHQASATWDRPESVDWLLEDESLRPWLTDYLGGIVRGPASVRFLGARRWLRYRGLDQVAEPWGWKDPRNTCTLPLWLDLFPEARVLHIVRHGVDVAESLRVRREREVGRRTRRYERHRNLYCWNPFAPKRRGFGPQARCATLDGAFDLWEYYVARAREHTTVLGSRALEVQYESVLLNPRDELSRVLSFCGVELSADQINEIGARVDPSRAYAFRRNRATSAFADEVASRLERLGYHSAPGSA